jgi:ParB-like chromosome segregation protein Spo0J
MQQIVIPLSKLQVNAGQVKGLPKNPRLIKDERYHRLLQSIKDDPEMLELRELIVFPQNGSFVIIAGNMRFRVLKELNYKEAPCKILDAKTPVEKLKAYTIKDNVSFGENSWDDLANEWDQDQLIEWGVEIPDFAFKQEATEDDYEIPDEIETDIILGDLFEIGNYIYCPKCKKKHYV